jgi:membrane-bound lytic murein transglycosylase MltF
MQVLPSTARDPAVGIEDIDQLEHNIHAGTRYLRHVVDTYFDESGIDEQNRLLFAFAAYNAGPARVRGLRRKAAAAGLDSTRWFQNVELMAAREIGRETVQYVANIYKYYVAFELTLEQTRERMSAQAALRESD